MRKTYLTNTVYQIINFFKNIIFKDYFQGDGRTRKY